MGWGAAKNDPSFKTSKLFAVIAREALINAALMGANGFLSPATWQQAEANSVRLAKLFLGPGGKQKIFTGVGNAIPDYLQEAGRFLVDSKWVQKLSASQQFRVFSAYCARNSARLIYVVPMGAKVSGTVKNAAIVMPLFLPKGTSPYLFAAVYNSGRLGYLAFKK